MGTCGCSGAFRDAGYATVMLNFATSSFCVHRRWRDGRRYRSPKRADDFA